MMNPRTQKVYESQRRKMMEHCNTDDFGFTLQYAKEDLQNYLDNIENINTRKNYYANIVNYLKNTELEPEMEDEILHYRERMLELCNIINNVNKEQKQSKKQEDNWMSLQDLNKMRKNHFNDIKKRDNPTWADIQPFFVASLYLADDKNPPIRNEYGDMLVVKESHGIHSTDKSKNYLVITGRNKKTFILNDFKNVKSQGTKSFKVGKSLNKIMNTFLDKHPFSLSDTPTTPLLFNTANNMLGRNGLTKYLQNKVFTDGNKKISTAMLRHIYISEKVGGPMIKEKEDLADKMCHSVAVQEGIYKKWIEEQEN